MSDQSILCPVLVSLGVVLSMLALHALGSWRQERQYERERDEWWRRKVEDGWASPESPYYRPR